MMTLCWMWVNVNQISCNHFPLYIIRDIRVVILQCSFNSLFFLYINFTPFELKLLHISISGLILYGTVYIISLFLTATVFKGGKIDIEEEQGIEGALEDDNLEISDDI